MTKFLTSTGVAIALLAAPAHAQLLGGGLGGSLGGGLGMPIGSLGGSGNVVVSRTGRSLETTATTTATQSVRAPRLRKITRNADVTAAATGSASAATRKGRAGGSADVTGTVGTGLNSASNVVDAAANINVPTGKNLRRASSKLRGKATTIVVPRVSLPPVPELAIRRSAIATGGIVAVPSNEVHSFVDRQYIVIEGGLAGTGATVTRRGEQIVIEMPADVTFAFDKSDIRPRFIPALNALANTLNQYPATYIDVYGHTDSVGTDQYNQALSERRAASVARFLSQRSVLSGRMHTEGHGELEPKDSNATVEGRASNRRVEIVLTPYAA